MQIPFSRCRLAMTDRNEPLVSILIPAYNSEAWIADAIQSAVGQTWDRKEIIIVDDGSADRTLKIAKRFESKIVRVVTQQNCGAAAARNAAFSLSGGDYIQWLDADDLLDAEKIARQMKVRNGGGSNTTLFSGSWGEFFYSTSRA